MSKTILFFGNERLATGVITNTPLLNELVLNGYKVAAIIIVPTHLSASRRPRPLEVSVFAASNNIPLVEIANLKQALAELKTFKAELGILAAFGKIIPQEIIDIFPLGIINIHPSLLPKHRGPIPIEAPILAGEAETGVSLMQLVAAMDAGPIYDQVSISLSGTESKQQLADQLGVLGAQRLIAILPKVISGELKPRQQAGDATYDTKISPAQSRLELTKPAIQLDREIRAFLGWPRSRITIKGVPIIVTKAHAADNPQSTAGIYKTSDGLALTTKDGVLIIDRLIAAGSKEMSAIDYLRGHPL